MFEESKIYFGKKLFLKILFLKEIAFFIPSKAVSKKTISLRNSIFLLFQRLFLKRLKTPENFLRIVFSKTYVDNIN
ncbi:hypothetical protein BGP_1109 [Beggiatoa sp. PS]|nr:hypothetical protein BGP_1109 [Beggiatoa sp. PS]